MFQGSIFSVQCSSFYFQFSFFNFQFSILEIHSSLDQQYYLEMSCMMARKYRKYCVSKNLVTGADGEKLLAARNRNSFVGRKKGFL